MKTKLQPGNYEDKFNECDARFEAIFQLPRRPAKSLTAI